MTTVPDDNVIALPPRALDRAEKRAKRALHATIAEADDALAAVSDGDIDSIWRLHVLVSYAVRLVLDHRLATAENGRPRA